MDNPQGEQANRPYIQFLFFSSLKVVNVKQTYDTCTLQKNKLIIIIIIIIIIIFVLLLAIFMFIGFKYKRKPSLELKEEVIQLDTILAKLTDNDESLLSSKRQQESTLSLRSLSSLKRKREFDAFVLYHFDSDDDFVVNSLIPELEEVRNLRMNIHSRDFQPGCKIDENIEAIKSSNNAITTSRWCADEFTHCYIEHVEDPAFKLFVIMMEPLERLTDVTPNMKTLFAEQTYLELEDPQLFTKLSRYLRPDDNSDTNNSD